ncbi:MAG TPA: prolipoprotein diacylglyceryl transferase [Egicoccus sp.]|nr:prolipoprotein diacylglyceryl transferase [Egicoccus sp.]HSK24018.1 prolipoprotein diacylglyceryl transferase [Egicoccus sp.]
MQPVLATIPPPPFNGFELGPLDVRLYGILIAFGAYLALRMMVRRYESFGGDPTRAETAALVMLGAGFLGARLAYVLPRLDHFLANPQDILAIWQGGLALFGGLTVGSIVALWYARSRSLDVPALMDAVAPTVPLAQAIGRWGNYFNQELYGRPTDVAWALEVEAPYRRPGYEDVATFHPTFLYESLWNLALVGVLLWLDRRGRLKRGALAFVYLIGYGIGRAWIEALRVDTADRYFGLSRNNWVALAVIIIGTAGLVWWQRRPVAEPEADADFVLEADMPDDADTTDDVSDQTGESHDTSDDEVR